MREKHVKKGCSAAFVLMILSLLPAVSQADTPLAREAAAIDLIARAADRICVAVNLTGTTSTANVKGEVNAQVSGLVKRLAFAGVGLSGARQTQTWSGLLAKDMAEAVHNTNECRQRVFDKLFDRLLPLPIRQVSSRTTLRRVGEGRRPSKAPSPPPNKAAEEQNVAGHSSRPSTRIHQPITFETDNAALSGSITDVWYQMSTQSVMVDLGLKTNRPLSIYSDTQSGRFEVRGINFVCSTDSGAVANVSHFSQAMNDASVAQQLTQLQPGETLQIQVMARCSRALATSDEVHLDGSLKVIVDDAVSSVGVHAAAGFVRNISRN